MTARSTSVGALLLRAMVSQLAVVLLSPPFKSCGWDLTAVPPRQLPAAQELVGARNLVHSMVKASHVGPAAVELCHESRGVFTNSASSLSTGSFSLQVRAWSLQYPQRVYTRILSAPAATVEDLTDSTLHPQLSRIHLSPCGSTSVPRIPER